MTDNDIINSTKTTTPTESVVEIKKSDYKNIIDEAVENRMTINVLKKIISESKEINDKSSHKNLSLDEFSHKTLSPDSDYHTSSSMSVFKKKNSSDKSNKFPGTTDEVFLTQGFTTLSNYSDETLTYNDTDDIYRATETENGLNRAYRKINEEIDIIDTKYKNRNLNDKQVIDRIDFLVRALKILDQVKEKKSKK
jgi:hypothetical protein